MVPALLMSVCVKYHLGTEEGSNRNRGGSGELRGCQVSGVTPLTSGGSGGPSVSEWVGEVRPYR